KLIAETASVGLVLKQATEKQDKEAPNYDAADKLIAETASVGLVLKQATEKQDKEAPRKLKELRPLIVKGKELTENILADIEKDPDYANFAFVDENATNLCMIVDFLIKNSRALVELRGKPESFGFQNISNSSDRQVRHKAKTDLYAKLDQELEALRGDGSNWKQDMKEIAEKHTNYRKFLRAKPPKLDNAKKALNELIQLFEKVLNTY
ncbi:MAG: hypothetical protein AAFQ01_00375, partial [Bacteroidota bacterium]